MSAIHSLYCDGGLIGKTNPSHTGGMWAWCQVGSDGERIGVSSGIVLAQQFPQLTLSNNVAELYAALQGMASLPNGWTGTIWTDSSCTRLRISQTKKQAALNGVPEELKVRLAATKQRLGRYSVMLVAGHPNKRELATGRRGKTPCSPHNVFCDQLCREERERFLRRQNKRLATC